LPETNTVLVEDLDEVARWVSQNASSADQARMRAIIDAFARDKQRQYADQPTLWEIDWLFRGSETEVYRLALIDRETRIELWGYS
jgi:hypothetical protein